MHNSDNLPNFPKENRILYDWLSLTTKKYSVVDLIELLGLRECPFETVNGSKGFMYRQYFSGISIHFNPADWKIGKDFIWLEMSGQGCRSFETYGTGDYDKLFSLARDDPENVHITRLDIAFDDVTDVFSIECVCDKTRLEHFVSRQKTYQAIYSNKGNSVVFGSRQSNILIRIYDKAAERGYDNEKLHWIRCELQLRDENAMGFVGKQKEKTLQELYTGILKNYLSFREPTNDSNKRRWPESEWWTRFLDDAAPLSVWCKPGVEYNLTACERYVITQPIGSIKTLIEIHGKEAFLDMVKNAPPSKNPKYKRLIAEAEAATKVESRYSTLKKWVELAEPNEMEVLAEIQDGYREIHIRAEEKNQEHRNRAAYEEGLSMLRESLRKERITEEIFKQSRQRLRERYNIDI